MDPSSQAAFPSQNSTFLLMKAYLLRARAQCDLRPQQSSQQDLCLSLFAEHMLFVFPSDQLALQIWRKLRQINQYSNTKSSFIWFYIWYLEHNWLGFRFFFLSRLSWFASDFWVFGLLIGFIIILSLSSLFLSYLLLLFDRIRLAFTNTIIELFLSTYLSFKFA